MRTGIKELPNNHGLLVTQRVHEHDQDNLRDTTGRIKKHWVNGLISFVEKNSLMVITFSDL